MTQTNTPTNPLTRYDLIVLSNCVASRLASVTDACSVGYTCWQDAEAGSDEAKRLHAVYQADCQYAADLRALWDKVDAMVDAMPV